MNRRPISEKPLLVVLFLLLLGGLVMVFGASAQESMANYHSPYTIFIRQLIAVAVGLFLMMVASRLDYRLYGSPYFIYPVLGITLVLLIAVLFGPAVNDTNRWIQYHGFRFQPSEGAKLAVILFTAAFLARRKGRITAIDLPFFAFLAAIGVIAGLILKEPDFGTATSILLTASALIFVAGLRLRFFLIALVVFVAPGFYFAVYRVPYRWERIVSFLNPDADPLGAGYQLIQSLIAVGSGGIWGVGLNQSVQKLSFLPEPHTDFIFAVIGEELGLIGTVMVVLLFVTLVFWAFRLAFNAPTIFGMYAGLGITIMIAFQALFNISVVIGLTPTKGIPLPFISVGGSSMLVLLISVGILLNISRQAREAQRLLAAQGEVDEAPGGGAGEGRHG